MDMVDSITAGVASVVSVFLNILIGLVSMIYMLGSKDVFTAQSRRAVLWDNEKRTCRQSYNRSA